MPINFKAEESQKLEDGKKSGEIVGFDERTDPYHYVDIVIKVDGVTKKDGSPLTLKYGCPATLTKDTKLGRLLKIFTGQEVVVGQEYDVEALLFGKKVTFMTQNKVEKNGTFARIIEDSLKPA